MIQNIQKQLGLENEEEAERLLFTGTFDFYPKAQTLMNQLIQNLQSTIDLYEIQTGKSVEAFHFIPFDSFLDWMKKALTETILLHKLEFDLTEWAARKNFKFAETFQLGKLTSPPLPLLGLLNNLKS